MKTSSNGKKATLHHKFQGRCFYCLDQVLFTRFVEQGRLVSINKSSLMYYDDDNKLISIRIGSADHVIDRSKGGSNQLSNLVLACVSCNSAKGCHTHNGNLPLKFNGRKHYCNHPVEVGQLCFRLRYNSASKQMLVFPVDLLNPRYIESYVSAISASYEDACESS